MIPGHPYAGFWRRAGGYLLDYVLVLLPSMVISFIVTRVFAGVAPKLVSTLIFWPLMLAYFVIGNGSGATFGKRWMGVRVSDAAGALPGLRRAAVRAILPFGVSLLSMILVLGASKSPLRVHPVLAQAAVPALSVLGWLDLLWMIWDPRKQTLHDKLA